jgi:heme/copper-type cytochrome/quinol oxidase subunit 4
MTEPTDILDQDLKSRPKTTLLGTVGFVLLAISLLLTFFSFVSMPTVLETRLGFEDQLSLAMVLAGAAAAAAGSGLFLTFVSLMLREPMNRWKMLALTFSGVILILIVIFFFLVYSNSPFFSYD